MLQFPKIATQFKESISIAAGSNSVVKFAGDRNSVDREKSPWRALIHCSIYSL